MDFSNIDLKDLAIFIFQILKENGINAILVGGGCVSIYSQNRYQSYDLDFATYEDLKSIEAALQKIGFKRNGRSFSHKNCRYLIDFVNPPISIGHESVRDFETLQTSTGSLQLLTPTDCVKDRLVSFFYWNDQQALEQALLVAKTHQIDITNLKNWAKAEGNLKKLEKFLKQLNES